MAREMDATEATLREILGITEETSPSGTTMERIAAAVEKIEQYLNYDIDAEAYAAGTRGGVPVEEGDPAYHNNAAYYAGQMSSVVDDNVGIEIGTLTSGKYINRNDGTEGNDSNSNCSDFIPVKSGLYVTLKGIYTAGTRGIALYDSNKVYKSSPSSQAGNTKKEFLIPDDVAYMRFTTYKTTLATAFYSNIDTTLYSLLTNKLNNNFGASNAGKHLAVSSTGSIITAEPFNGYANSTNPIDANAIKENGWYRGSASGKQYFSHIPSDTYGVMTLYTTMNVGGGETQANQWVIDQRMSIWGRLLNTSNETAITDWVKLVDNSGASAYQVSRWFGKTIKCFGDSRTWYDGHAYNERTKAEWTGETCIGYQQTLARLTGATIQSDGHSGATSPTICEYIRAANLTGIDAVLLEGGVNDYIKADQVTIGTLQPIGSAFDTTTVYGAWQSAVEYILTNYPEVKIFMTVPAIAWDENGAMPYSTAEIKKNVAELYNIPCLDLYKNGGINQVNRDYYYVDDVSVTNWRLHFNDYGNALIGAEMAGFINTH